jgi:hypothetical protein
MRYFYGVLLSIIVCISVFTILTLNDNTNPKQTALAQAKNIDLHYFQVDTAMNCSDSFPNRGVATFKIKAELNSNGSPIQSELGYTYRQHYVGTKHGDPVNYIVAEHLHRPSQTIPFADLEATVVVPTHINSDHVETITFFVTATDIATNEKFNFVNKQDVPTCVIPFAEAGGGK